MKNFLRFTLKYFVWALILSLIPGLFNPSNIVLGLMFAAGLFPCALLGLFMFALAFEEERK